MDRSPHGRHKKGSLIVLASLVGLLFSLVFDPAVALIIGVVLCEVIWIVMGGVHLFRMVQTSPTPLTAA